MNPDEDRTQVTFDGDGFKETSSLSGTSAQGFTGWIIAHSAGIIKNEKQASNVALVIILAAVAVSFSLLSPAKRGSLSEEERLFLERQKSTQLYDNTLFSQ